MTPPLITLEEHFWCKSVAEGNNNKYDAQLKHLPGVTEKLQDLDALRLQHMDAGKVTLQVVSHAPGTMSPEQCIAANDQLAGAINNNPDRFAGFAVLPVSEPKACADELRRCVQHLGFVGALIDNHTADGKYFDGEEYEVMWQAVQELDVPVYLHPTWSTDEVVQSLYAGNFPTEATMSLSSSGWGWHSDVAIHVLRLFAAGLFDRFPRLKIIIGHFGEMLPFMLDRIEYLSKRWGKRERVFKKVWDENIWITTSGVWSVDPMACILRNTKIERILYSVDYPFAKNEDGLKWIEKLDRSGLVSKEQLDRVAYKNAEDLLRIRASYKYD